MSQAPRPGGACHARPPACALFMTARCNLACAWCRRKTIGPPRTRDLGLAAVRALLKQYPGIGAFAMAGQGEPTLAEEFADVVRFLADEGKRLILDTNGVNSRGLDGLGGCFTRISLSLYGHDRDSFRQYTGVDGFDAVLRSWDVYKRVAGETAITSILDRDRPGSLGQVLDLCDRLQPDVVLLYNPLCYDPLDSRQRAKIITAQDEALIADISAAAAGRPYAVHLPPFPDFSTPRNSCRSYCEVINMDGDGNIGGCLRKVVPDGSFGNVFTDADCFNTPAMTRLRRRQMVGYPAHPECADCFGAWGHGATHTLSWKKEGQPACKAH